MDAIKEMIRKLDSDYGFNLTEEEIYIVARQVEANNRLFEQLYDADLTGIAPVMKIDKTRARK